MSEPPRDESVGSAAEEAAKLFATLSGWAADAARDVEEHLATDASECRYCPICRTVHLIRETGPEVRGHLAAAAANLMQAAAALLSSAARPPTRAEHGFEHIDLDTEEPEGWSETSGSAGSGLDGSGLGGEDAEGTRPEEDR